MAATRGEQRNDATSAPVPPGPMSPAGPTSPPGPTSLAGVRDAVLEAAAADATVLVRGGGTKLGWGCPVDTDRHSTVIDTRGLDELIHHEPGDMTVTVQSGMALETLQEHLAAAGQWFAVDPPSRGGQPTVGGVFAGNDAGPWRLGHGGIRDLVIGSTTVLADGTVSRSGGRVIKNVAGYDLNKLWCGSLGTLGLVTELTLRLHPLPEAVRTVRVAVPAAAASPFLVDLLADPVECAALEWSDADGGVMLIGLAGRVNGLAARVDAVANLASRHGLTPDLVDGDAADEPRCGPPGGEYWRSWRAAHAGEVGTTVARVATVPADLTAVAAAVDATAAAAGTTAELHSHAALGLHDAVISGGDLAAHAATVAGLRSRVKALGGSVVVREHPAGLSDLVGLWGERPDGLIALDRAIKQALDPDRRFAPGRFAGGL